MYETLSPSTNTVSIVLDPTILYKRFVLEGGELQTKNYTNHCICNNEFTITGQLVEKQRVCFCSGRSEAQVSIQANWTQCCQRLANVVTYL